VWIPYTIAYAMAERLRSTGRKSNKRPSLGVEAAGRVDGTASRTMAHASAADAAAAKNAAGQLAIRVTRSAHANESEPATPMLAACDDAVPVLPRPF
jgi:hypothetical protein